MNAPPPQRSRLRFGIGSLLLTMVVISVASAAASYMLKASDNPGWQRLVFILFTLAAPVILLIIMTTAHFVLTRFNRR